MSGVAESPQVFRSRNSGTKSACEGPNPGRKPGNFPGRGIFMDHALLRAAHDFGLRILQRGLGSRLVAGGDRLFDLADIGAHAAAAVLVDRGAALGDASRFLCGFGIGHLSLLFARISHVPVPRRPRAACDVGLRHYGWGAET